MPAARPSSTGGRPGRSPSASRPGATSWPPASWPPPSAEAAESGADVEATLDRLAREEGARIADAVAPAARRRASPAVRARSIAEALAGEGYEPRAGAGEVTLSNCPFSALVSHHPELTCRMNLALLEGFSQALPGAGVTAHLRPAEGRCCVLLEIGSP